MYNKAIIAVTAFFVLVLLYFAYKYNAVNYNNYATPKEYVAQFLAVSNQFSVAGLIIIIASWIGANIVALFTKKLGWFWIPFLFIVMVNMISSYQTEALFLYKQANDMWDGSFSISFIGGAVLIIFISIPLLVNYKIVKNDLKKQKAKLELEEFGKPL